MTRRYVWWQHVDRDELLEDLSSDADPRLMLLHGGDSQGAIYAAELAAYTLEVQGYECHFVRRVDLRLATYQSYLLELLDLLEPGAIPHSLGSSGRPLRELVARVQRAVRTRRQAGVPIALILDDLDVDLSRLPMALESLAELAVEAGCLVVATVRCVPRAPRHAHTLIRLRSFTVEDVTDCLRGSAVSESDLSEVVTDLFGVDAPPMAVVAPMLAYQRLQALT